MKKVRQNIFVFALRQARILGIIGLLLGIIYSFGGLIVDILVTIEWISSTETPGLSYGTILAFGALIGMPLIAATIGFVTGIIEAALYNLFQRLHNNIKN